MTTVSTGARPAFNASILEVALATSLHWNPTGDALQPWQSTLILPNGETVPCRLQLNDFPAEPLYTLLIAGAPVGHLDDWPARWQKA